MILKNITSIAAPKLYFDFVVSGTLIWVSTINGKEIEYGEYGYFEKTKFNGSIIDFLKL